jgi:hypothetical protein
MRELRKARSCVDLKRGLMGRAPECKNHTVLTYLPYYLCVCVCVQSRWLVDVLTGKLELPPQEEQEADVAAYKVCILG